MIQLLPANQVNFAEFVDAFNHAYADYFVKVVMSVRSFEGLIRRDAVLMTNSVVAVDNSAVVGMALLAQRGNKGWIGGVGVIPPYRRRGIARQMMHYVIDQARQLAMQQVTLEVIEINHHALYLYETLGFQTQRRLLVLERDNHPVAAKSNYRVEYVMPSQALIYFDEFHDMPNPWQRSYQALTELSQEGWVLLAPHQAWHVIGYCLTQIGFSQIQIIDLALDPEQPNRAELTQALMEPIHQEFAGYGALLVNHPADHPSTAGLLAMDYRETLAQFEMTLTL